jgi:hypothetical protein
MGISQTIRELYQGLLVKPGRVCELGSQDIHFEGGIGLTCREWMEAQGWDYTCIDLDGHAGALRLDLNTCSALDVGIGCVNAFDVVTNHGTSEHVFNQYNVFKLMHDLTKLGGMMIHAVPTPRFGKPHGFYFYDETIFYDLAHANNYGMDRLFVGEPNEVIVAVLKKQAAVPFQTPTQGMYRHVSSF